MKKTTWAAAGLGFVTLLLMVILLVGLTTPYLGKQSQVTFHIPQGASLTKITGILDEAKAVRSPLFFKLVSRLTGSYHSFQSGTYKLEEKISLLDLISLLQKGQEQLVKVTIPEGKRMTEIFEILKAAGLMNQGKYQEVAQNPIFISSLNLPFRPPSLEGLLYPDTYLFGEKSSEELVLKAMIKTFWQKLPPDYAEKAQRMGMDLNQALTLASIIEKETGKGEERRKISSVFHNRLKKNMRLQTDPTVIYGLKDYQGNIKRIHLKDPHPYNTYVHRGLPPGAIANPGLEALLAAVNPEQTPYLYFVARGDGYHEFSVTYEEHNQKVNHFQRWSRKRGNYKSY